MQDGKENILKKSLEETLEALSGQSGGGVQGKLVHNILLTIERRRGTIDWLVESRSRGRVKGRTRKVLSWALAEMLWMDGVPAPAVVDAAVDYVKRRHSASEAGFVNGLLRGLLRDVTEKGKLILLESAPDHVRYDLPEVLWRRWTAAFGAAKTVALADILQTKALVVLRRRFWPKEQPGLPEGMRALPPPEWAPWAELYTPAVKDMSLDDVMGPSSSFYIQDMATLLAPTLLAPRPGERVADLCCAPGGKARILAEMMQGRGKVLCSDKAEEKLPRVRRNLAGLPNVVVECHDAVTEEWGREAFDGVLLDVPCSNTGVIRRKPDVRWNFSEAKLRELAALQSAILDRTADAVRMGGRLVYSTCSIEDEENGGQVRAFLARHPDYCLDSERTLFPDGDHDGAYAALLVRDGGREAEA